MALWKPGGESLLANPAGRARGGAAERGFSAGLGAGFGSSGPGKNVGTDSGSPGRRHRAAPLRLGIWTAPSAKDACTPRGGRGDLDSRRPNPECSKRAHACAEESDHSPRHDQFLGIRVGEASNPGPAPLGPWEPDPAFTSQFATFGEGWVVFVYNGLHDRDGSPTLSFKAAAPLGGRAATFRVLGEGHLFCGLATGQA